MKNILFLVILIVAYNNRVLGQELSVESLELQSGANLVQSLKRYDDKGRFSCYESSSPFQVNYFLFSPSTKKSSAIFCDDTFLWSNEYSFLLRRDGNQVPTLLLMNDKCFRMLRCGVWHISNDINWDFKFGFKTDNVLSLLVGKKGKASNSQIKPFEFIAAHSIDSNGGSSEFKYIQAARGIHFDLKAKKGNINLIFRTPSDQIRFGYPLESLWFNETKSSTQKEGEKYELLFCLNSLIAGKKQYCLSFSPKRIVQYEKHLPPQCYIFNEDRKNKKYIDYGKNLTTKKQITNSGLVSQAFFEHRDFSKELEKQVQGNKCEIEKVILFLKNLQAKHNIPEGTSASRKVSGEQFETVINLLYNLSLQAHIQTQNQIVATQDQFMLRNRLDHLYGSKTVENLYELLVNVLLCDEKTLPHQKRFILHEAIAKLGYSKWQITNIDHHKTRSSALVDSVYSVRTGPPGWLKKHSETVQSVEGKIAASEATEMTLSLFDLSENKRVSYDDFIAFNNAIVEILIIMDKLQTIHENPLRIWYKTKIEQTRESERYMNLSILTLQPSGRNYLLDRLEKNNVLNKTLRRDIINHLDVRLKATIQTKRYDFIPIEECNRIKKIIGDKT